LISLSVNAFTGSSLEYLDLALNRLQSFNPTSFQSINETLLTLDLLGNSIVSLPPDGFSNIRNIRRLILNNNPLWNIPSDAFRFMTNLVDLFMGSLGLWELNPGWFESLPALESLHIQQNNIGEIPNGIFASNLRLRVLEFYLNNVRSLNVAAFGQPQSLQNILAQNNRIRAFDPAIIDRARNLNWLMLSGNICNRDDFFNVQNNLEFVRERLNFCFANSGPEILQCRYSLYDQDYTCSLQIFNPLGRENFDVIEGEHMAGRSNNDVTHLYSGYGNTLNVPEIICQQFPNLVEFSLLADQIEYIDHLSFTRCARIERIWLYANLIEVIPDFVFM
jgi:Leucine-rich repeat (LRR) protein